MASLSSPIINALLYEEMGVIEEEGLLDNFIEEIMNNPSLAITSAFVTDQIVLQLKTMNLGRFPS